MPPPANRISWMDAVVTLASVGGGCGGVISRILIFIGMTDPSIMQFVGILVVVGLYLLGVASGLLQYADPPRSARLFRTYLIAQIPITKSFALSYKLFSLARFSIVLNPGSHSLDFGGQLGADWQLAVFHPAPEVGLGINLVPVLLLSILWRHLKRRSRPADAVDAVSALKAD